jgi:hypothetical protein
LQHCGSENGFKQLTEKFAEIPLSPIFASVRNKKPVNQ